jgi:hypothetical protein
MEENHGVNKKKVYHNCTIENLCKKGFSAEVTGKPKISSQILTKILQNKISFKSEFTVSMMS